MNMLICVERKENDKIVTVCQKPIYIAFFRFIEYEKYHHGRWTYTEYGWKPVDNYCSTTRIERSYSVAIKTLYGEIINNIGIRSKGIGYSKEWGYDDINWENRDKDISTGYEEVKGDIVMYYYDKPFVVYISESERYEKSGYNPTYEDRYYILIGVPVPLSLTFTIVNNSTLFIDYIDNNIEYIIWKLCKDLEEVINKNEEIIVHGYDDDIRISKNEFNYKEKIYQLVIFLLIKTLVAIFDIYHENVIYQQKILNIISKLSEKIKE